MVGRFTSPRLSLFFVVLFFIFMSCFSSGCGSGRKVVKPSQDGAGEGVQESLTVPKGEYDKLLGQYEALLQKNRQLEGKVEKKVEGKVSRKETPAAPITPVPPVALGTDEYSDTQLGQTKVDGPASLEPVASASSTPADQINLDIQKLRQIQELFKTKVASDQNMAMSLIKGLEQSPSEQIQVRAKFLLAEKFFEDKEYDLAMQGHEDIIGRYAFSGLTLKSLERLVACSEKLNLTKKYKLYYSYLTDQFGVK